MELTSSGLIELCNEALNKKTIYMWGTYGSSLTEKLINAKVNQYPKYYSTVRQTKLRANIGKGIYALDCCGLIKCYLFGGFDKLCYYSAMDRSAGGFYRAATIKGAIETMPEIPGLAVWKDGHIGVYVGGGYVIEATLRGKYDGVVKTRLSECDWTHWLKLSDITYEQTTNQEEEKFEDMEIVCEKCALVIRSGLSFDRNRPTGRILYTCKKGDSMRVTGLLDGIQEDGYQWIKTEKNGICGYSQYDSQAYWLKKH